MTTPTTKETTQKITISLPQSLAERFKAQVPPRRRSELISQILEEYLALEEQAEALDETAGCWTDENHPELSTGKDIDQWLANLRSSWQSVSSASS